MAYIVIASIVMAYVVLAYMVLAIIVLPQVGHRYTGHTYIGHNYMDHNYIGHGYVGHNYIGLLCSDACTHAHTCLCTKVYYMHTRCIGQVDDPRCHDGPRLLPIGRRRRLCPLQVYTRARVWRVHMGVHACVPVCVRAFYMHAHGRFH